MVGVSTKIRTWHMSEASPVARLCLVAVSLLSSAHVIRETGAVLITVYGRIDRDFVRDREMAVMKATVREAVPICSN
jgi:pyridoxine 5'-phosphate synthase PdxJ